MFYCFWYFGLGGNGIVFVFIKVVNKVNKEMVVVIGLIIVDEILLLCFKLIIDLIKDLVIVFWFIDDFEDN